MVTQARVSVTKKDSSVFQTYAIMVKPVPVSISICTQCGTYSAAGVAYHAYAPVCF